MAADVDVGGWSRDAEGEPPSRPWGPEPRRERGKEGRRETEEPWAWELGDGNRPVPVHVSWEL